jgi:hypothetical protein
MMALSKGRHHPKNKKKKKKKKKNSVQGRALNVGEYASWAFFEDPFWMIYLLKVAKKKRKPTERLAEEPKFEIKEVGMKC